MAGEQREVTLPLGTPRTHGGLRPSRLPGHRCRREAYVTDIYQNVLPDGSIPAGHAAPNLQGQFEGTAVRAWGEEVGLGATQVATQPRQERTGRAAGSIPGALRARGASVPAWHAQAIGPANGSLVKASLEPYILSRLREARAASRMKASASRNL